jgi:hypothetical protein
MVTRTAHRFIDTRPIRPLLVSLDGLHLIADHRSPVISETS